MNFKINPSIDIASAAKTFREKGRVQIPDILLPEQAEAVHQYPDMLDIIPQITGWFRYT